VNPELRRNFWSELTTHRVLAMPAVLLLAFGAVASYAGRDWPEAVGNAATVLFTVITLLWGARRAGASVTEEVRARTWDWQRLSALSPWEIALGKLAGAPSFAWYGGALCLAAMLLASGGMPTPGRAAWLAAALVASAIAMQSAAMAASL